MYFVTAHPPPATGVETSSASVQLPDPNINFSTPTCSSKLPIESQTVYGDSSTTSPLDLSAGSSAGSLNSSPISEFLVYPTVVNKAKPKQVSKSARILTSCESLALLEEKKQKKEEEEKEKARRKKEREEKRLAKKSEKRQKQQERETKKLSKPGRWRS